MLIMFGVQVTLRHVNNKVITPPPLFTRATGVSIFGNAPPVLWLSLPTAAELFGSPAKEVDLSLVNVVNEEKEATPSHFLASLRKCTLQNSLFRDLHLFAWRDVIQNLRAEGQLRDKLSVQRSRPHCCSPFTQFVYCETARESVTQWAQHSSLLHPLAYR